MKNRIVSFVMLAIGALALSSCSEMPKGPDDLLSFWSWYNQLPPEDQIKEMLESADLFIRCLAIFAVIVGGLGLWAALKHRTMPWHQRGWNVAMLVVVAVVFMIGYTAFLTVVGIGAFPENLTPSRYWSAFDWKIPLGGALDYLVDGLAVITVGMLPIIHKAAQFVTVIASMVLLVATLGARRTVGILIFVFLPLGLILKPSGDAMFVAWAEANLPDAIPAPFRFFTNGLFICVSGLIALLFYFGIPIGINALGGLIEESGQAGMQPTAPEGGTGQGRPSEGKPTEDEEDKLPEGRGEGFLDRLGRMTLVVPIPVPVKDSSNGERGKQSQDGQVSPKSPEKDSEDKPREPSDKVESSENDDDKLPPKRPDVDRKTDEVVQDATTGSPKGQEADEDDQLPEVQEGKQKEVDQGVVGAFEEKPQNSESSQKTGGEPEVTRDWEEPEPEPDQLPEASPRQVTPAPTPSTTPVKPAEGRTTSRTNKEPERDEEDLLPPVGGDR